MQGISGNFFAQPLYGLVKLSPEDAAGFIDNGSFGISLRKGLLMFKIIKEFKK